MAHYFKLCQPVIGCRYLLEIGGIYWWGDDDVGFDYLCEKERQQRYPGEK